MSNNFDFLYPGRMERKHTFYPYAIRNLSDSDGFSQTRILLSNYSSFVHLYPLVFPFDDGEINPNRISDTDSLSVPDLF
jgi:hypothetical protein